MKTLTEKDVKEPADVPDEMKSTYAKGFLAATHKTGRLMLFAGDQKIEHLNSDFYGNGIHQNDSDPEHLFRIACEAKIGVFATQLGLIARYGMDYRDIQYLVKLNSKTNLVKDDQKDPISKQLIDMDQLIEFQNNYSLKILGVGYTIYLGSEFEAEMLREATQIIFEACC